METTSLRSAEETSRKERYWEREEIIRAGVEKGKVDVDGMPELLRWATDEKFLIDILKDIGSIDFGLSGAAENYLKILARGCAIKGGRQLNERGYQGPMGEGDLSDIGEYLKARNRGINTVDVFEGPILHFMADDNRVPSETEKDILARGLAKFVQLDLSGLSWPPSKDDDADLRIARIDSIVSATMEILARQPKTADVSLGSE